MEIEKIKKSGLKYKITLDNGEVITTFDEVILENNLLYDKHIDSELLNKINNDTVYYESYNKAIRMICRRLRSEFEIREYLKRSKVIYEDIDKIVDTLKRIGLINDENFAKAYTNDKVNLSLDGPYKIAKNLKQHKINDEVIREMINSIDEDVIENHLAKIISKKQKTNKDSEYIFKRKMLNYLSDMGYDISMIHNHLNNMEINSCL